MTATTTAAIDACIAGYGAAAVAGDAKNQPKHDFDELRRLLQCDNPSCRDKSRAVGTVAFAAASPKRCARCHQAYYCSVDCQRADWKKGGHKEVCFCVETKRAEWEAETALPDNVAGPKSDKTSSNSKTTTACGICLEETIHNPVALSNCGHVFCFSCLANFQARLDPNDLLDLNFNRIAGFFKKPCPYCRAITETNIMSEALSKAEQYVILARRLCEGPDSTKRASFYRLANIEVEKVLAVDPIYVAARVIKASILTHEDPLQAVQYIQETVDIERIESEKFRELSRDLNVIRQSRVLGPMQLYVQLRQEFSENHQSVFDMPRVIGQPLLSMDLHLAEAQAYEAAGQHRNALEAYGKMAVDIKKMNGLEQWPVIATKYIPELIKGRVQCCYHVGNYITAIETASKFLAEARTHPGAHQLVALPLLALAERYASAGGLTNICGHSPTLAGAIEVMYKGFVYEDQFNIANKEKNRLFLQELCDKKAAADGISSLTTRAMYHSRSGEAKVVGAGTVARAAAAAASPNDDDHCCVQDVTLQLSQTTITTKAGGNAHKVQDGVAFDTTKGPTRRGTRGKKDRKKKR